MTIDMTVNDIRKFIPHRYPFLLVDRVLTYADKSIVAIKNVTINEPFFNGHFPAQPVMPGVLMVEALAQAGGVLAYKSTNTTPADGILYYLAGVNKARFKRKVIPGDQLHLSVEMHKSRGHLWQILGRATVDGELACSAELMCFKSEGGLRDDSSDSDR